MCVIDVASQSQSCRLNQPLDDMSLSSQAAVQDRHFRHAHWDGT